MSRNDIFPPKYRKARYNGKSIYTPDFGTTSIRFMTRRMAERLETQKLSELGVQAFGAWLHRLIWEESMWLATATYSFRDVLLDHLEQTFREYPGLARDRQLIEDALYAELKKLSDRFNFGPQRTQRPRHLAAVSDPFRTNVAS